MLVPSDTLDIIENSVIGYNLNYMPTKRYLFLHNPEAIKSLISSSHAR